MKKRLLAMMMAFVMAMSLLPMSALAVGGGNSEQPPEQPIENPGVTFTKELIPGESGNPDKIKLEAYVDGEVKEENVPVDCDIVLVLDQSGSMVEKITDSKYEKVQQPSGGWTYNTVNDKDYYYFDGKNYRPVKAEYDKEYERCWDRNCDQYHEWNWIHTKKYHVTTEYYLEYGDGNVLGNKATSPDEVLYTGDLYKLVSAGSTTRLQAMKDAAQTFIDAVQDAEGNHRVAVVGFASDSDNYNNAKYENSEVLTAPTSNGNSKVYSRVTGELKTDGSQTYYIAVAETAEYREINYNSNFKMWQDGFTIIDPATTPIYIAKNPETYVGKKYDTLTNVEYQAALVAPDSKALENAIGALAAYGGTYGYLGLTMAKNIFDKAPAVEGSTDRQKVIVYITDGEDSKKDKARKVADALAGTGYNAEIYSIFVGTLPTNESKKNAIVSFLQKDIASSEDNYANASNSEQLKKFIQEIATGSTTKTEIKANLTDKTVMTDEISDYFKVSGDIEVYTAAKNAPGEASEWADEQQLKDGVTVDVNGKTVTVTGFNFAANCVTSTDKGDGDYGKKLVVYIPIKEDDIGFGGYLPTNASATLKDDTTNEDFSTDPAYKDCEVSAPVLTGKTVDRVALYDLPSIADLFTHDKTPDGSNNAGVNMVYTLKQGDTTIATKSVSAGKAFDQAEWVWTDGYADKVDDMQAGTYTYTLDCQVTCIKDHNPAVVADSDQATATVNIRNLTFTFDANGGSWADEVSGYTMNEGNTTAAIEANMGDKIAQIATEPTRKGYEFLGWYSKNKKGDLTAKWWGSDDFSYKIYEDDTVYAKWEEIPTEPTPADKTGKLYVNLQDEKGTWLGGTNEAIPVTNEYTVSFTAGENVDYEAPEVITTASGDRYIYDCVVSYSAPLTGTLQKADENIVVCLQYTKDNWNDKDDETTGGDGIPDKYQAVVLFKSKDEAKGTVTGDGIVQVFTFSQPEGDKTVYLEKGTVDPDMTKVTATAKSGYKFDIWTKDEGTTSVNPATAIENVAGGTIIEFYANWAAKENNTGGGGSSKPPVLNKEDHYAYIVGYPDGTVKPQGNITRAEVATIFFRMLTDDSRNEFWSQTNSYSDVSEGQWFNNAISTLANAGILSGYPDGTFRPNAPITRAEFTKIAASFFERVEYTIDNPFNDVDDDDWFYKFVMAAYEGGLITGYPEGDFRPNANISRAESVTIVNRTLERAPDADHFLKDMIVWPDNAENAWYYEAVQEATNSHEYVVKGTGTNKYEEWTKILEVRDWPALEKEWSNANSATGGEVVK